MKCLKRLRDPQSELLLLHSCMSVAKLLFGLRTCQPSLVGGAVSVFDEDLRGALEDIVVCRGAFFGDLQWRLASLPTRFRGLGICTAEDTSSYAFVASRAQSWGLQDHILRECGGDVLDSDYRSALDRLHSSLPDLDIGGFYIKDTVPPKSQKIPANTLYGEIVKRFEEKFFYPLGKELCLNVYVPHMLRIFYLSHLLKAWGNTCRLWNTVLSLDTD
ncbi:hypothetical protein HanRHA438_Chr09g0426081 [Helianthus annuus]|nr:hypothetical protein HanRHA438_Chr09g0426081 [Helianthus annuus]